MIFSEFDHLLAHARATAEFRADLASYTARKFGDRITASAQSPRVKVLRVIAQLLHSEPTLVVDQVRIEGVSGCADYTGHVTVVEPGGRAHVFEFEWNCEWKALQLGYVDAFGLPDQIRAAEEFGWQCFAVWARSARGAASLSA